MARVSFERDGRVPDLTTTTIGSPEPSVRKDAWEHVKDPDEEANRTRVNVKAEVLGKNSIEKRMRMWKDTFQEINSKNGVGGFQKYHVANFFFLLVLIGTEMDMAGIFFSAPVYLAYDPFYESLLIMLALAFVLPLAFVTAVPLVACCFNPNSGDSMERWAADQMDDQASGAERLNRYLSKINPHGGNMMPYHWIPCLRFYLIVKAKYTSTDVDAIFKVNSISSFTLGVFQLIGIMATIMLKYEITLYVKINIATQILNWFLTLCYFATPIPRVMAVASHARALSNHYQGILQEFASQCAKEINTGMGGMDIEAQDDKPRIDFKKDDIKVFLAKQLEDKFLGGSVSVLATGGAVVEFRSDMQKMRDIDVKDFLLLLRNQNMSVIDVRGGL